MSTTISMATIASDAAGLPSVRHVYAFQSLFGMPHSTQGDADCLVVYTLLFQSRMYPSHHMTLQQLPFTGLMVTGNCTMPINCR
jgi:hypothetical protein